jgi:hypothetical protein
MTSFRVSHDWYGSEPFISTYNPKYGLIRNLLILLKILPTTDNAVFLDPSTFKYKITIITNTHEILK